jgi:hypothetical protein
MAFRKELIPEILPIPETIYMHDYWIGAVAEQIGTVKLIWEPLILYRRHSDNVTQMQHGSIFFMLEKRWGMLMTLLRWKQKRKKKDKHL